MLYAKWHRLLRAPCASAGDTKELNNLAKRPSEENVRSAKMRLKKDMREVSEKDRQTQSSHRDNAVYVIGGSEPQAKPSR